MDFTLALTHFCDLHGPKSVLCTQVLPLLCPQCQPSPLHAQAPNERDTTHVLRGGESGSVQAVSRLRNTDKGFALPVNFSRGSISSETKHIEQHPYFRREDCTQELNKYPYGRSHGDTCASCTFTVPQKVAVKLPEGAPGSLPKDGTRSKYGAPVLRSREFVCLGRDSSNQTQEQTSSSQESQTSSVRSIDSTVSHSDCHDHTLTYLTSKSPDDIEIYAQLRTSVVRALSCEALPRGTSEGPFCFGDSTTGYTIAYVFRLTDSKARGRRRTYAFVALAGQDAYRAFKACPMLWEAFATMSKSIEQAAQKHQDEQELQQQRDRDDQLSTSARKGYTEPSSFLTQRPRDPDGQPRRAGQTQPRSLAEITGNENIFAILHQYFVAVLRCLGDKFGGLPLAEYESNVYGAASDESHSTGDGFPARVSDDMLANLQIDDEAEGEAATHLSQSRSATGALREQASKDNPTISAESASTTSTTPTPSSIQQQSHHKSQSQSQCAPMGVDVARQRQVRV